ncbi:MAG: hypothetical protein HYU36_21850 [Planctomycetes bacterium]|nr:hypothetical protein [Planctomycetota bacterium]
MKPLHLGRRNQLFRGYDVLLWDDRLEEIEPSLASLEVTRFFLDEAVCATAHRARNWHTLIALAMIFLAVSAIGLALWQYGKDEEDVIAASIFSVLAVLFLALTVNQTVRPSQVLVLHASDQKFSVVLPRSRARQEEAIRRFLETVEAYQARQEQSEKTFQLQGPDAAP